MTLNRTPISVGNTTTLCNVAWENEFKNKINHILTEVADFDYVANFSNIPAGFLFGLIPSYTNASTVSVGAGQCRDSTGTANITIASSQTIATNTAGLNGLAQSTNLTGTIAVNNGIAQVTGSGTSFTSTFVPGDTVQLIGVGNFLVTAVNSNVTLTVSPIPTATFSGLNYRRGGKAINTWYYLYGVTNSTASGVIASSRNTVAGQTLTDLPTGYTKFRQLPIAFKLDALGNIIPFYVGEGWPYRPRVLLNIQTTLWTGSVTLGTTNVLNNGGAASFTSIPSNLYIPPISTIGIFNFNQQATGRTAFRKIGDSHNGQGFGGGNALEGLQFELQTNTSQQIEYRVISGAPQVYLDVLGFIVTEV